MDVIIKQELIILVYSWLWTSGLTAESDVNQPSMLWKVKGDNATIECKHSKGVGYYQMYWYRQQPGKTMKQIVLTVAKSKPDFEADFESEFRSEKFSVTKPDALSGTFIVRTLVPEDEGLYFCAGGYQTPQILNSSFIHHWDFYWIIEHCKPKRKLF
ncbi:hypothetical protein CHARACLAT_027449 [Characodon lateralis]|uniref:Ig-like domain-containing protein n=1 Tax=Characodon lateralis TaxID=208331 RepID=A0ABU7F0D3_9TELE|nr:hypothetical protein [Characodon lateralis]